MFVLFRRTGPRRYSIEVQRPSFPVVEMNPAPGYDELMPHDLVHMVVEARLGLSRGIFGQLAAGGDAGTFHITSKPGENSRQVSRVRRDRKARGAKLLREGREDCAQSERATYICWYEWLSRSQAKDRQKKAQEMLQGARQVRGVSPASELDALNTVKISDICEYLDALSSNWSKLKIGESMSVSWPDLNVSHNQPAGNSPALTKSVRTNSAR
jgi:hypothetical protein